MHLSDLLSNCIYKDFGALHLFNKPQGGEIFVEIKLYKEEKGAEHRHLILTMSFLADLPRELK